MANSAPQKLTKSAGPMLSWQYRTLLGQLDQVNLHSADDSCPCHQVGLQPAEYCIGKHLLSVSTLCSETSLMDPPHREMLASMSAEALEYHEQAKKIYCKGGTWPDLEVWSRECRKKIEPIYYSCDGGGHKKSPAPAPIPEDHASRPPLFWHLPPAPAPARMRAAPGTGTCDMISGRNLDLLGFFGVPVPDFSLAAEPEAAGRKIDEVLDRLKTGVAEIQDSDHFRSFLLTMAKFHDYSIGNTMLIMLQAPMATRVAGFTTWKNMGRFVKAGSKGIAILAPCVGKKTPEEKAELANDGEEKPKEEEREARPVYFRVVYVFDISQTEGKEVPEFDVPVLTGDANEELFSNILAVAKSQSLEVGFESRPEQDPGIKGVFWKKNIWVRPEESRAQQLKSLIHELSHYFTEDVYHIPRRDAETIAESTAFVVGAHFGFDSGLRSFPYVAIWSKDKKVLQDNLSAIRKVTGTILDALTAKVAVAVPAPAPRVPVGCTLVKRHDDGDLTVKCKNRVDVLTTDGRVFTEKTATPLKHEVCAGIKEASDTHVHFLTMPPDPVTGSHEWHRHWIDLYAKTLNYCGCSGHAPPAPPQPFGWTGGKHLLAGTIVQMIPPHKTYVEAFCGGAAVFWKKQPSQVEVLNDMDKDLIRFYRNIGGIEHCNTKALSRDFQGLKDRVGTLKPCEFIAAVQCSFGSKRQHPGVLPIKKCQTNAPQFHKNLDFYKDRLKAVNIMNVDWETALRKWDASDTFFFLDPPYHGTQREYVHKEDELARLARVLPSVKGKFLLTYDDDPDVRKAFARFHVLAIESRYTVGGTHKAMAGKQLMISNYPVKLPPAPAPAPADTAVKIAGQCTGTGCTLKVKAYDQTEQSVSSIAGLSEAIENVRARHEEKHRLTPRTFAFGSTGHKYEFQYKVKDAGELVASHDPFTFAANEKYPQELQPRLRARAAGKQQVVGMAANLDAEVLLADFQSLDRGAPIVGPDGVVESGNGRVMAITRAAKEFPQVYARYREALMARAAGIGIQEASIKKMAVPILVRERLSSVNRKDFVEEANASTTIESSSIEKARTDAEKITPESLFDLRIGETESIEDALRAPKNKPFVSGFLAKLPANEQAKLVDAGGQVNQDGIRRLVMAVFVSAFAGDAGLKLAERFFDSTDLNVRNVYNGIVAALADLARMEGMIRSGSREKEYSLSDDLARSVAVFSALRRSPGMTVPKYLAQHQLFERELSTFQEKMLTVIYDNSKSSKKIAFILKNYAGLVTRMPAPQQTSMMELSRPDKAMLFDQAVAAAEQEREINAPSMFAPAPAPVTKGGTMDEIKGAQFVCNGIGRIPPAPPQGKKPSEFSMANFRKGQTSFRPSESWRNFSEAERIYKLAEKAKAEGKDSGEPLSGKCSLNEISPIDQAIYMIGLYARHNPSHKTFGMTNEHLTEVYTGLARAIEELFGRTEAAAEYRAPAPAPKSAGVMAEFSVREVRVTRTGGEDLSNTQLVINGGVVAQSLSHSLNNKVYEDLFDLVKSRINAAPAPAPGFTSICDELYQVLKGVEISLLDDEHYQHFKPLLENVKRVLAKAKPFEGKRPPAPSVSGSWPAGLPLQAEAKSVAASYIKQHGHSSYSKGREGQIYDVDGSPHVLLEDNGDRGLFQAIGATVKGLSIPPTTIASFKDAKNVYSRQGYPGRLPGPPAPAQLDRCVADVKAKGGAANPYAVCHASLKH